MDKEQYVYNPELPFIKDFPGNKIVDGRFTNDIYYDIDASLLKVLKWKLSRNPQKEEKENDTFKLKVIQNDDFIHARKDLIVWLGHASFFIRLEANNNQCF